MMAKDENLVTELETYGKALLRIAETLAKEPSASKTETKKTNLTLEDVRAVLAEKARDGFTAEVRNLLQKHGADKLSSVSPEEYSALLKEAEGLSHAG